MTKGLNYIIHVVEYVYIYIYIAISLRINYLQHTYIMWYEDRQSRTYLH